MWLESVYKINLSSISEDLFFIVLSTFEKWALGENADNFNFIGSKYCFPSFQTSQSLSRT